MPLNKKQRNMHLIRHLPPHADYPASVAIGNFDGVHRGHVAVIAAMRQAAEETGATPTVLTFEPHPRRFFAPTTPAFRITRLRDKLARLEQAGVAQVVMPRFNSAFATMPAEAFLEEVLHRQLGAKAVVTGENFAFGHQRRGDSALLRAWGAARGVTIITVPPVQVGGEICSSSTIRHALKAGEVARASTLLGYPYMLTGRVIHGAARGRTIGFPTANIALPPDLLLPAHGVYAVRATIEGQVVSGVANLGIRPTVSVDNRPSLEVHLFDFMQEIYGKMLEVQLVDKLRDEMKFAGIEALQKQIATDCEHARFALRRQG